MRTVFVARLRPEPHVGVRALERFRRRVGLPRFERCIRGQERRDIQRASPALSLRQAKQVQSGDAASERLADALHEPELLRIGEPERRFLARAAIDSHLDVWPQLGRLLNLVDQHRRLEALQKERGIRLGKRSRGRIVQRDVIAVLLGQVLEQRGVADLSRSGQEQDRELLRGDRATPAARRRASEPRR
jgi:hypothetical protein